MSIGNTKLVEYGIHEDRSEFRAHVGIKTRRVYLYRTEDMQNLVQTDRYKLRSVWTPIDGHSIETARGWLVPVGDIPGLITADISEAKLAWYGFADEARKPWMTTSDKGDRATKIVNELLESGELRLPLRGNLVTDRSEQIAGNDLIVTDQGHSIQTKCDFKGGEKERGGTGNLFIQQSECNPLKAK